MNETNENEIMSLDDFRIKIKDVLPEEESKHESRFAEFNRFLRQFDTVENLNKNPGAFILLNDYFQLIKDESIYELKSILFDDLAKELRAHLSKLPILRLPDQELNKRKRRQKIIRKEILNLNHKIEQLKLREMSLDDLVNEQDNVVVRIEKYEKRLLRLYKELRTSENKHQYHGEDDISFKDLTNDENLNKTLSKEILSKFKLKKILPNYKEVFDIVQKYSTDNSIQLNNATNAEMVFKKICLKLKQARAQQTKFQFNSYLNDRKLFDEPETIEDEELKRKLDSQNHFKKELDDVVFKFLEKANNLQEEDDEEEDETGN